MKICLAAGVRDSEDGKFQAVIYVGEFDTANEALAIALQGSKNIGAALAAARDDVEKKQNGK